MIKKGIKHSEGKLRWDLIPWRAMKEVVKVRQFGIDTKYPEKNNWQHVEGWQDLYRQANMRHVIDDLIAHEEGFTTEDPESRLAHLAHAVSCALFILEMEIKEQGKWVGNSSKAVVSKTENTKSSARPSSRKRATSSRKSSQSTRS